MDQNYSPQRFRLNQQQSHNYNFLRSAIFTVSPETARNFLTMLQEPPERRGELARQNTTMGQGVRLYDTLPEAAQQEFLRSLNNHVQSQRQPQPQPQRQVPPTQNIFISQNITSLLNIPLNISEHQNLFQPQQEQQSTQTQNTLDSSVNSSSIIPSINIPIDIPEYHDFSTSNSHVPSATSQNLRNWRPRTMAGTSFSTNTVEQTVLPTPIGGINSQHPSHINISSHSTPSEANDSLAASATTQAQSLVNRRPRTRASTRNAAQSASTVNNTSQETQQSSLQNLTGRISLQPTSHKRKKKYHLCQASDDMDLLVDSVREGTTKLERATAAFRDTVYSPTPTTPSVFAGVSDLRSLLNAAKLIANPAIRTIRGTLSSLNSEGYAIFKPNPCFNNNESSLGIPPEILETLRLKDYVSTDEQTSGKKPPQEVEIKVDKHDKIIRGYPIPMLQTQTPPTQTTQAQPSPPPRFQGRSARGILVAPAENQTHAFFLRSSPSSGPEAFSIPRPMLQAWGLERYIGQGRQDPQEVELFFNTEREVTGGRLAPQPQQQQQQQQQNQQGHGRC